jgi:hypothetical protein
MTEDNQGTPPDTAQKSAVALSYQGRALLAYPSHPSIFEIQDELCDNGPEPGMQPRHEPFFLGVLMDFQGL